MHARFGTQWSRITKHLTGRTDNMVKNRFNGSLKNRKNHSRGMLERLNLCILHKLTISPLVYSIHHYLYIPFITTCIFHSSLLVYAIHHHLYIPFITTWYPTHLTHTSVQRPQEGEATRHREGELRTRLEGERQGERRCGRPASPGLSCTYVSFAAPHQEVCFCP